jgi:hypothetical protein
MAREGISEAYLLLMVRENKNRVIYLLLIQIKKLILSFLN